MKLIDSSAWIEYYRPNGEVVIANVVSDAIAGHFPIVFSV